MLRRQAYRFFLKPSVAQASLLRQFLGCARFVWNAALVFNEDLAELGEKRLRYTGLASYLIYLKSEYAFLSDAPSQVLQQTLRDLDTAYARAFNASLPAQMPRLKKKHRTTSGLRFPQGFRIDGKGVFLPKLGWMGFRKSREILGTVKNITVTLHAGHWYVAMQTEREVAEPVHPSMSEIGIDLGIATFAACSDGTMIAGPRALKLSLAKLSRLQRRLSRKTKFSANWRKAKQRVTRLHTHIAAIRLDALHKASTMLSKNHASIVMEDLRITNMTASAKGTQAEPGTNVRQKAGLNRSILDQGWGEFTRQIGYKLDWLGGWLMFVDPRHTSQTCSQCLHVSAQNRRSQSVFRCVACSYEDHADVNAAKNIVGRAGHARIACGDTALAVSAKQEARAYAHA